MPRLPWVGCCPLQTVFCETGQSKGLVALLAGRLESLDRFVNRFADVDDPYGVERVYGVAYGVAMRGNDATGIGPSSPIGLSGMCLPDRNSTDAFAAERLCSWRH